jgi:ABC-type transport system involved in multi-copper enzyme maturation permease subunit
MSSRSLEVHLAALGDRLNPVLVKEVRAALRGRFFSSVFAILLSLVTVASIFFMILAGPEGAADRGNVYFLLLAACMSLGVHGLVPFSAMLSMNAESDEHTLELLQLSGVAASRIVLGKLGSALVQALLVYSAFLPFLMLTFLQHGVGIEMLFQSLVGSLVTCATLSSLGILLGTLARARWARVLLLLLFALILFQSTQLGWFLLLASTTGGIIPSTVGMVSVVTAVMGIMATVLFVVLASDRLAHAEENKSTPTRVAVSLTLLVALAAFAVTGDPESGCTVLEWALGMSAIPMFLAATEAEALPRSVPATLPLSRVRRLIFSPWFPGGARGALFVVMHLAAAVLGFAAIAALRSPGIFPARECLRLATFATIFVAFVVGPAALLSRFTREPAGRLRVRLSILGLFAIVNIAPALLRYFLPAGGSSLRSPLEVLNVSGNRVRFARLEPEEMALLLLALLALLGNLPRLRASLRELLAVSVRGASRRAKGGQVDAAPQP